MRRRDFITLLGAAVGWPFATYAQQSSMAVVGFLNSSSSSWGETYLVPGFRAGLEEAGYVEGKNVLIDFRWAEGRYDRLPDLAAELVRRKVPVLFAGGPPAARAAKVATSTIPIVFTTGEDPVKEGLVASFNRPGGNATGINVLTAELETKRLGLLHEIVPTGPMAALLNPKSPNFATQSQDVQAAGRAIGRQVYLLKASTQDEIDAAFAALAQPGIVALSVVGDPFLANQRDQLVALAMRYGVPVIYEWRELAAGGGLISYGVSLAGAYRQAGIYVGRILKGEKPADLPVLQATKFELVINLKTAKALGLTIPPGVLAIADEVIE
jgi:putative ABC transport system substrate-binding protein